MLKLLVPSVCMLLFSAQTQAEMNLSSVASSSGQKSSASATIMIKVDIPVRASFKLSAEQGQLSSATNLRNAGGLSVSCHSQQGWPLTQCSDQNPKQIYTFTTL